jgi:tetracycline resistance efflux pump
LIGSFASLIPFLIVIPIAMWTKQVIPGLMTGLLVGAYMLHPTLIGGVEAAVRYLIQETSITDNVRLILFLYGFGAFVGLIRVTGGVAGFAAWMTKKIHTERGAFLLTWLSALATFMAPDFRIITIAPIVKQVFAKLGVPANRVAYAIDVTSTPLCAVVPIGTAFVGYMVGLMHTQVHVHGASVGSYPLFLRSLPFNFFSWVMLAFGLYTSFFHRTASKSAERPAVVPTKAASPLAVRTQSLARHRIAVLQMEAGTLDGGNSLAKAEDKGFPDAVDLVAEHAKPNTANLLFPLALLLVLTIFLTWVSGREAGGRGFLSAFVEANAAVAMLQAVLITLVVSVVYYLFRKIPIDRSMFGFLAGGNEMMAVIVLLVLVWGVSAVSSDLGFSTFTQREILRYVPTSLVAPALFVIGCAISYVIGSSFGTWGMLMPLGFSLAASGAGQLSLIAGAVFAAGTFGGFASPLSDNTVAMATVMKLPIMAYARHKAKTALWAAGLCTVFYGVAGLI